MEIRKKIEGLRIHNADIRSICRGLFPGDYTEQLLCITEEELRSGFDLVREHQHMATIFGSARTPETDLYYQKARSLAGRLVKEFGLTIATGGGPGIMEAGNRGAFEVDKTKSISMTIELPHEQTTNPYTNQTLNFQFFFTRKVIMTYASDAFIVFPGGFGTLNELFELLTLEQTHKAQPAPVILFGREFWSGLIEYIDSELARRGYTDERDESLFVVLDTEEEVVDLLKRIKVKRV